MRSSSYAPVRIAVGAAKVEEVVSEEREHVLTVAATLPRGGERPIATGQDTASSWNGRRDFRAGVRRSAVLTLTAGFLLAVLWFDLMFDAQALGRRPVGGPLAEPVLASIAAYYRHVTTSARRSEEHTSELQSRLHLVCRLLLEKKKKKKKKVHAIK